MGHKDTVSIKNGDFQLSGRHDAKRHYVSLAEEDTEERNLVKINIKAIGRV